jgi:hypothetical protein
MDVGEAMEESRRGLKQALDDLVSQINGSFGEGAGKGGALPDKQSELTQKHAELVELQRITHENLKILLRMVHDKKRLPEQ